MDLALAAKTLLVGKITESFEDNKMVKGAKRAIVNAKIRVIDTETGKIKNSKHYSFNKLDYTEAAALNKIREQLINQIVTDSLLG